MIQKFPIKTICGFVLLIFILWLWQATSGDSNPSSASFVSNIAPVSEAQAQDSGASGRVLLVNTELDDDLAKRLSATTKLIDSDQDDAAVSELKAIIKAQPNAVEPYINLAALYAKSKKIELARNTLLEGINVNQNTAVLFDSLQKVYAAQASLAYQRALEIDTVSDDSLALKLPKISTLSLNKSGSLDAGLKKKNSELSERVAVLEKEKAALDLAGADQKELKENNALLQEKLREAELVKTKLQSDVTQLQAKNKSLELAKINSDAGISQQSLRLSSSEKVETQLRQELSNSKALLTEAKKRYSDELARVKLDSNNKIKALQAQLTKTNVVDQPVSREQLNEIAISLVKSWANAWSAQNVSGYISHYTSDFRPTSRLSHIQWREQRRIRLTNKTFIEVDVSDFRIKDLGDKFSVQFLQHYRSNNVDDRIQKRLVFKKNESGWSGAKIVTEQVVTQ